MSPCTLYRLSWSHSLQRTCTILLILVTRSPRRRWLSAQVSNERPRGHNSNRILITLVLYFIIFKGVESVPPGTSDLGVTIQIGFWYMMQHRGEEPNEISFPEEQENMLHSDMVPSLLGERSNPIALFPTVCANTRFRWFPAYVEEARSGFTRGCNEGPMPIQNQKGTYSKGNHLKAQSNWCQETWIGWRLTRFKEKGR